VNAIIEAIGECYALGVQIRSIRREPQSKPKAVVLVLDDGAEMRIVINVADDASFQRIWREAEAIKTIDWGA